MYLPYIDTDNDRTNQTMETKSVCCQTDPYIEESTNAINMVLCSIEMSISGNNASTQTEIYVRLPQKPKAIISVKQDKVCGPDTVTRPGFTGYTDVASSNEKMRPLAGVSCDILNMLLELIQPGKDGQPKYYKKMNKENRLLLFLAKLKLGISFCALGCFFNVHATTVSTIFFDILKTLSVKTQSCIFWPSKQTVKQNLPKLFSSYPNSRCIIDCTEITTDIPSTVEQRKVLYSDHETAFTVKVLIVFTPDGFICKTSKAYGGRTGDCFIAKCCGFLDLIQPGDVIFAKREFHEIRSLIDELNATLVVPSCGFDSQSTNDNAKKVCRSVAMRNHVDRVIQRIQSFGILQHIDPELLPVIDDIIHVCCVITNFQQSLMKRDVTLGKESENN